ncbi:tetratricopeptide repeat protein [Shewanella maritima]|uniref:Tetratricopeptide repeat protein n=1 Tax=Shewanella maritima TaxID=2520507 RepID=A0A411PGL1_9GAMM|nr:tetratricopeptide repeat protein [Shewanella maritima]QBF82520.1 tetratricopeptide repeat protein [Shewanella maritima]
MVRQLIVALALVGLTACSSAPSQEEHQGNQQILVIQQQAEHAYKTAMLDQAESLYIEVLKSVPNYAPAWFRLGNIYTRTGRHDAAINAYLKCLELEPKNTKALYNISLVRIKQSTQVLQQAQRQADPNSVVTKQVNALLNALNELQREPTPKTKQASL